MEQMEESTNWGNDVQVDHPSSAFTTPPPAKTTSTKSTSILKNSPSTKTKKTGYTRWTPHGYKKFTKLERLNLPRMQLYRKKRSKMLMKYAKDQKIEELAKNKEPMEKGKVLELEEYCHFLENTPSVLAQEELCHTLEQMAHSSIPNETAGTTTTAGRKVEEDHYSDAHDMNWIDWMSKRWIVSTPRTHGQDMAKQWARKMMASL